MLPWDAALVERLASAPPPADTLVALRKETAVYRRIIDDGGTLAMGTDSPLSPTGLALHLGLRALHHIGGLSPAATLRTATVVPARLFGVGHDLGTLEPDKLADLAVIDGNPFQDFDELIRTSWVMRDGVVHRSGLRRQSRATAGDQLRRLARSRPGSAPRAVLRLTEAGRPRPRQAWPTVLG